jgi:hypothetical protein
MFAKGDDYANTDRLSNFKQVGYLCGLHPAKVALVLQAVKISRLCNLIDSGKTLKNESLLDSSLDDVIYGILTDAVLREDEFTQDLQEVQTVDAPEAWVRPAVKPKRHYKRRLKTKKK